MKVAHVLVEFETVTPSAWRKAVDRFQSDLIATLLSKSKCMHDLHSNGLARLRGYNIIMVAPRQLMFGSCSCIPRRLPPT